MKKKILESENKEYGFWGTTALHYNETKTQKRWSDVFKTLLDISGADSETIRDFLDSRYGRHFSDQCYNKNNVKRITLENYFEWLDKKVFDDETSSKCLEAEKNSTLFGTRVFNKITKQNDIVLYTYKNKNRVNEDYALCMSSDLKKYRIDMDYILPLEN